MSSFSTRVNSADGARRGSGACSITRRALKQRIIRTTSLPSFERLANVGGRLIEGAVPISSGKLSDSDSTTGLSIPDVTLLLNIIYRLIRVYHELNFVNKILIASRFFIGIFELHQLQIDRAKVDTEDFQIWTNPSDVQTEKIGDDSTLGREVWSNVVQILERLH